ncbi:hypothetical protein SAMN04487967_0504 [Natronorubrum sediminis]|uniref:Uncharacterized protein n=1 Tax=Natronorubrum sediminis TaxID=640943 RepID=A0A1H6FLL0_9EURY|nr:hypothetical protein [Natronorubrum sediminis]SEH11767.1 hypothetical protein SAMN04487967_0504 [Natronorubrum sediminis]
MTTDHEGLQLRFRAGFLEHHLLKLVLVLQFTIGAMICFVTMGFFYLTFGAYLDPQDRTLLYAGVVPYLIGAVVVVSLLNLLYE